MNFTPCPFLRQYVSVDERLGLAYTFTVLPVVPLLYAESSLFLALEQQFQLSLSPVNWAKLPLKFVPDYTHRRPAVQPPGAEYEKP